MATALYRTNNSFSKSWQILPGLITIPENESCAWPSHDSMASFRHPSEDPAERVNDERKKRGLDKLSRSSTLDELARIHASNMAASQSVFHSVCKIVDLQFKLSSLRVGENIQRGESLRDMHRETMASKSVNRSNILSPCFDSFGSAVVTAGDGEGGELYCCQLFCERPVF